MPNDFWNWTDGELSSAKIFDGDEREHKCVIWINTRTGRLCKYLKNNSNSLYINPNTKEIAKEIITAPLPIRIEWDD